MENLVQELEKTLDDFHAMQEAHKKAMGSFKTCDLESLIFERSRAFADLKEQLSALLRSIREAGGRGVHIAPSCQSMLTDILKAEQQLIDQASEQRDHLAVQLEGLATLKRGLTGYARNSRAGFHLSR